MARSICSTVCVDRPTIAAGPTRARTAEGARSSWPTWTPSAAASVAISARSLTMSVAPQERVSSTIADAVSRNAPLLIVFARSCRKRAPPSRKAFARSSGCQPARAAASTSTIAFSAEIGDWGLGIGVIGGWGLLITIHQSPQSAIRNPRWSDRLGEAAASRRVRARQETFHERGVQLAGDEFRIDEDAQVQRNGRLDALDHRHLERPLHARDRFAAVAAVDDDLRDHRIVVRRDRAVRVREGFDADAGAARDAERVDQPWRRHERLGILGVDAALDRVAREHDVALLERQPLTRRDPDLLLDDVDAGYHLGNRMLDLQARVRFHEVEAPVGVHQELEGPGVRVLHGLGRIDDDAAHPAAHLLAERRRRRLLDQLLMAALDRALALAEMDDRSEVIAEDLELDVARRFDVFLDVHVGDAERRLGLALRGLDRVRQFARGADNAHAAAAAAGGRLDDHREADLFRQLERLLLVLDRAVAAGQDRDAGLLHHPPGAGLVAHQADRLWIRADELDVARLADLGEIGALREKPVAGMDRVGAGDLGGADHRRHVEIAVGAARRADADVLVGKLDVELVFVGFGVDRDGLDAEFATRVDDAQRDFPAVRDQDFFEHRWRAMAIASGSRTGSRRTGPAGRSPRRCSSPRRRTRSRSRSSASSLR